MLSARAIKGTPASAAKYYAVGDYYTKGVDEQSHWNGSGATRLGLSEKGQAGGAARISQSDLEAILKGELPPGHDAAWRRNNAGSRAHQPGWDFTLSPPKSVSVAALVGGDKRLIEAHEQAVDKAVQFLERYAVTRVRTDNGKIDYRNTNNLTVARFTEFTSREMEAQLHSHNVIANMTFDDQTKLWRSLHSHALYTASRAMGQVYQNELAKGARAVGWETIANEKAGTFELVGVPDGLNDAHSTRSKQTDAYAKDNNLDYPAGRDIAALETRAKKQKTSVEQLQSEWRSKAGPDLQRLDEAIEKAIARQARSKSRAATKEEAAEANARITRAISRAMRFGLGHATASEAVVEESKIIQHALQVGVGDVSLKDIDGNLAELIAHKKLIRSTEQTGGAQLYRGRILSKDLSAEHRFARLVLKGRGTLKPILTNTTADRRIGAFRVQTSEGGIEKRYPLSPEQHAAAKDVLTSNDRIHHVQGVGGAGKSAMVGAIRNATRLRSHLAISKTAIAAEGLGSEAGIRSMTIDRFLQNAASDIERGGIVFIDEASMLGTRAARRIDELAETKHFRLVVIGDEKQLPAIEQGKPHALAQKLGAATSQLKHSRRHKSEAVKAAVAAAREGRIDIAFQHADTVNTRNKDDLPIAVANHWAKIDGRERSRILALDNKTRVAISSKVRDILIAEGKLARSGTKLQIISAHPMSKAELKLAAFYPKKDAAVVFHQGDEKRGITRGTAYNVRGRSQEVLHLERRGPRAKGDKSPDKIDWNPSRASVRGVSVYDVQHRELGAGDIIQWRRNEPELNGLRNGVEGTVKSIDGKKATIEFADNKTRRIDLNKHETWDHGYALTVYKAQGATYDRAIVVAPARSGPLLNQQSFYTAVSRARYGIDLWTNDPARLKSILVREKGGKTSAIEGAGALKSHVSALEGADGRIWSPLRPSREANVTQENESGLGLAGQPDLRDMARSDLGFVDSAKALFAKIAEIAERESDARNPSTEREKHKSDLSRSDDDASDRQHSNQIEAEKDAGEELARDTDLSR